MRNIIEKCKYEPKLFYGYINWKIKNRKGVDKPKLESTVYKDALQLTEVINKCFQAVLTRESELEWMMLKFNGKT